MFNTAVESSDMFVSCVENNLHVSEGEEEVELTQLQPVAEVNEVIEVKETNEIKESPK
jgi:hypothetical protein